jgi:hypothetical protein
MSSLQANNMPVYATTPQNNGGSLNNASGAGTLGSDTNGTTIYTAGTNGSRVYGVFFATTDTTAGGNNVFLYIKNGSTVYPIGQINVPVSSGNVASTPCVDGISPINCPGLPFDGTGKPYIELASGSTLKMSVIAAVAATKTLYCSTIGADY